MILLDQPIPDQVGGVWAGQDEYVEVKAFQIVYHVSLAPKGLHLSVGARRLPAALDTGSTAGFAMRRAQLDRRTGLRLERVPKDAEIGGVRSPMHRADVWVHERKGPFRLQLTDGIIVYPNDANPARLPILGLRAILLNGLRWLIDGRRRLMVLKTPGWS